MTLPTLTQSPRDAEFVQNPYPFYDRMRAAGPLVVWDDYSMPCAAGHAEVSALLRDRRFGREVPKALRKPVPDHLIPWQQLEDHSMLEREPPAHTRLRKLVLHGFTSRRVAGLRPQIAALSHDLIDRFEGPDIDLLPTFAERLPVIIIARLIGVPEDMADQLLSWSHAMVAMYQARRDQAVEEAAGAAAAAFTEYLEALIQKRRTTPQEDLLTSLIAARDGSDRLSDTEVIATTVLLLNAGHEATVHTIGNGVKAVLEAEITPLTQDPNLLAEEVLRFDPPLHMFTRFATEELEMFGHVFQPGDQVALLLGAANRDPAVFDAPSEFRPERARNPHLSFGAGLHFCVGAPLARAEVQTALPILFERFPHLALAGDSMFADRYHFRGLKALNVALGGDSVSRLT